MRSGTLRRRAQRLKALLMRLTTIISIAAVGLMVVVPGALAGQQSTRIGTGSKTCTVKPGASCKGVKHVHDSQRQSAFQCQIGTIVDDAAML